MSIDSIKKDYLKKIKLIKRYNQFYYNENKSLISDSDFDKIKGNPNFSVIGHITPENQGLNLVTRASQEIELKAQGWNSFKGD